MRKSIYLINLVTVSFTFLVIFSIGCTKKNVSFHDDKIQRQRSLELEGYTGAYTMPASKEEIKLAEKVTAEEAITGHTIDDKASRISDHKTHTPDVAKGSWKGRTDRSLKKTERIKKILEKKSVKIKNKISAAAMNRDIKLGLILILVGILIAVVLGIINPSVFSTVGAIVAVIGIVFLIIGLIEMS